MPLWRRLPSAAATRSCLCRSMTAASPSTSQVTTTVTIVGFLQVFINEVNTDGSLNVTVLNVAGCGNNATNAPIPGTSPVPVRLVTPP